VCTEEQIKRLEREVSRLESREIDLDDVIRKLRGKLFDSGEAVKALERELDDCSGFVQKRHKRDDRWAD